MRPEETSAGGDPVVTNPDFYRVLWENDDVRVLQYHDVPGQMTTPHSHPDTVMIALTSFRRRLIAGERFRDVALEAGTATWLPAQSHSGMNTGTTETSTILVELKHGARHAGAVDAIGPDRPSPAGS